ncbi:hypothetical protein CGZ94_07635 [Enemella evansiae]|uniref:Uncharacterized protein n=1 Tax=Enemella evansiae TaxID=2016499 RepID=A0A255GGC0_9ACTN|nr:hypothetical protein [Enemella evansiae]OYO07560.1 hypothetical protein CGZ98_19165 [Enemella evansiae]OYO14462.1 hypothetical protein CGZ94_07635 [Enemella evansiae]
MTTTERARAAVAPLAPGRIGVPLPAEVIHRYLGELDTWVAARRRELDLLDAAVVRSPQRAQLTRDMMLSMALWKAVKDRLDLLLATWDSGRVGTTERERISALVWGRLDATLDPSLLARADAGDGQPHAPGSTQSGLAVSLPEACRLSDAMAAQLRTRLALDPAADELTSRLRDLRAQLERIRDQVQLEPAALRAAPEAQLADLDTRVRELTEKHSRGGDVGGMIGPAEIEAARFERDLIVGGVERRRARGLVDRARELRADLESREVALTRLVDQCVRQVAPAPKYAVPDVAALGELPNTAEKIEAYLQRLDQVSRAMQVVQDSYSRALGEREKLLQRMESERAKAAAAGFAGDSDLVAIDAITSDVLQRRPSPIPLATELVEAYEMGVQWLISRDREGLLSRDREGLLSRDRDGATR